MLTRSRVLTGLGLALAWALTAFGSWLWLFTHSSAEVVVASHDAVVQPTLDGHVRVGLGPYLPDLRTDADGVIGVRLELGKTTAGTAGELAERYAAIAAHPEAERRRVRDEVLALAGATALRAAVLGLVPVVLWLLVGPRRFRELLGRVSPRTGATAALAIVVVVLLLGQPWREDSERVQQASWIPLQDALSDLQVPAELQSWEIQGGLVTRETRRLLSSMFETYEKSVVFYEAVVSSVGAVSDELRSPGEGETVAVLVSDRHLNIGMDDVVHAVAQEAGASAVLTAGDDTSTGETWEAFSLDSLDEAFEGYDARLAVAGNHDNGPFVSRYLERLGWTHLDGKSVEPFGGVRITGVDDPRSSGLGVWREEKGLSFHEVEQRIADDVCRLDEDGDRIATLLVHDANLGRESLRRGCTDLVLAGHLHERVGPRRVVGTNGKVGYTYTNGTTGGAAYSIAIGSKLRRDAMFTLVTYADGRPAGVQPVTVRTTGELVVAPYVPLELE